MVRAKLAISILILSISSIAQAQLVYQWDFTSVSNIDSINGVTATLANPAGLSAAGYTFTDVGEGISVNQPGGLAVSSTYTIELDFSLDDLPEDEYQRLIAFKDLTIDEGMYVYDDYFYFYDESPDDDTYTISPDEIVTFQLSRDGSTDRVTASLNGTELWSFIDSNGYAEFDDTNNIMHFFEDDSGEHPAGTVREIRVYANSINTDLEAVPTLPFSGLALLAIALGWLGFRARKRNTSK